MRASDVPTDEIKQGATSPRGLLPALTVAIFLSAALLFAVQPMFTKMVLPRLGGSPQVWTVAMVFFQATLLAGYAYARALTRLAPLRVSILTHLAVMIAGCPLLPLAIASGWARPPAGHEAWWLLTLFGVSIGLPFFALAANAPLLQAWFARTDHPAAKDPYFLYAASNVLRGAGRLCTRSRALSAANGSDLLVVGRLLSPDRAHCSVRLAVVACRRPSAGARHIGNDDCPVLARRSRLGRARGGSGRAPGCGHRAHFDRHRGGAVALGHPSVALSSHLRRRIRAPADHPAHRRDAAAADCRFHPCGADVVLSFRKDSDGRCRTSLGVLRQRADVPRRTRAPASGAGVLDVVLLVAFARRHDRRGADRSRRAPRLQLGGRISATDWGRGSLPVADARAQNDRRTPDPLWIGGGITPDRRVFEYLFRHGPSRGRAAVANPAGPGDRRRRTVVAQQCTWRMARHRHCPALFFRRSRDHRGRARTISGIVSWTHRPRGAASARRHGQAGGRTSATPRLLLLRIAIRSGDQRGACTRRRPHSLRRGRPGDRRAGLSCLAERHRRLLRDRSV